MQTTKTTSISNGRPESKATNPRARKNGGESASPQPTREQIASLAHQLYLESGSQEGRDAENWLRAEQILRQQATKLDDSSGLEAERIPTNGNKQRPRSQQL